MSDARKRRERSPQSVHLSSKYRCISIVGDERSPQPRHAWLCMGFVLQLLHPVWAESRWSHSLLLTSASSWICYPSIKQAYSSQRPLVAYGCLSWISRFFSYSRCSRQMSLIAGLQHLHPSFAFVGDLLDSLDGVRQDWTEASLVWYFSLTGAYVLSGMREVVSLSLRGLHHQIFQFLLLCLFLFQARSQTRTTTRILWLLFLKLEMPDLDLVQS